MATRLSQRPASCSEHCPQRLCDRWRHWHIGTISSNELGGTGGVIPQDIEDVQGRSIRVSP
ncbi:hypothetical protein GCM10007388_15590 [Pseudoduganella plicata]|uniref:Uncharacterized protein n=1 Tax=Pseudoduganella plicata TaxID=321984 RepID=A0AA87YB31_9BURK|nr:hypothetical protein GCM10007388_15590 [Pseudoduganella plicata]